MVILDRIETGVRRSGRVFAVVTSMATIIMTLMGTIDIIGTKLFKMPLPITYEATEAMMVALVFGGLAYAQQEGRHVRVELLVARLSARYRAVSELTGLVFGIVFFAMVTWVSFGYFWKSWSIREAESGLYAFPIYPSKGFLFIGALIMLLQLLVDLRHMPGKLRKENTYPAKESRNQK